MARYFAAPDAQGTKGPDEGFLIDFTLMHPPRSYLRLNALEIVHEALRTSVMFIAKLIGRKACKTARKSEIRLQMNAQ